MGRVIRADLDQLPSYVPGRSVAGAVKLASNEVAAAAPPSVVAAIADAAAGINRYPSNAATKLANRLAARLDVPASQLALGPGSLALCQQLVQATFSSQALVDRKPRWRHSVVSVPAVSDQDSHQFRHPALQTLLQDAPRLREGARRMVVAVAVRLRVLVGHE